ncbi:MAG: hypothetical protein PHW75_03275 [Patescibacteria group bacterium]|nr:hypothetical protein [Patescibacteria group bacterium]
MAEKKKDNDDRYGALFVPAGVLTGIGVGFLIENIAAGTMIGLGVGFLIFATITVVKKK